MRRTTLSTGAQVLARVWLVAALASLLLPSSARLGWWLPLHLALAGAASSAVAGAMPDFAAALSAGRVPRWSFAPLAFFAAAVLAIAVGHPTGVRWLTASGGIAFAVGAGALVLVVDRSWRSGVNRRHRRVIDLYRIAAACPVLGGVLGMLLGAGLVEGDAFLAVRRAHVGLNLLGFLALTIAATSILLWPTVLRVRASSRPWGRAVLLLAGGLAVEVVGLALDLRALAAVGAVAYAVGALDLGIGTAAALRPRPTRWERAPALHLGAAIAWLGVGTILQAAALVVDRWDRWLPALLAVVAAGVVVQALVGAWSYLVPMRAPGGPDEHRRRLAVAGLGAWPQAAVFNVGVLLLTADLLGALPTSVGAIGVGAAAVATALAVAKVSLSGVLRTGSSPG